MAQIKKFFEYNRPSPLRKIEDSQDQPHPGRSSTEMIKLRDSLSSFGIRKDIGLTTVEVSGKRVFYVKITHRGNIGNSISTVNRNIERYGFTIQKLKRLGDIIKEKGSPEYSYELIVKI